MFQEFKLETEEVKKKFYLIPEDASNFVKKDLPSILGTYSRLNQSKCSKIWLIKFFF